MLESTEMALVKVWGASKGRGNGATCLIRRNGQIVQFCDFFHNANHAGGTTTGRAFFGDGKAHHPNSVFVGVELSNPGRVRRDASGWRIAFTGAERVPVDAAMVVTDAETGSHTKMAKWGWCSYTPEQYASAQKIVDILRACGVDREHVTVVRQRVGTRDYGTLETSNFTLGHTDFDPSRKDDPGPLWHAHKLEF
jgi:N-acetyl-anhydromuramyl-L-alanine amidase AmpD